MRQATRAYGAIANKTANPRELEADLLLNAAARLQAIRDGWADKNSELDAALLFNRKLWSIFVTSATNPESQLPVGLRQNVANLGIFVFKQTLNTTSPVGNGLPSRSRMVDGPSEPVNGSRRITVNFHRVQDPH